MIYGFGDMANVSSEQGASRLSLYRAAVACRAIWINGRRYGQNYSGVWRQLTLSAAAELTGDVLV